MAAPRQSSAPLTALHDLELASLASAGGRDAFGELARRHGSAVRALLRRMGAEATVADDLTQDAFLTAYERIDEFRGEGAFAGWVKRIAARLYLRRWRKKNRPDPLAELQDGGDVSEAEGQVIARLDLDAALSVLSPTERLCVSLCYGSGFSHSEVAESLALPLGTVKSHVKRGLDKLKQRLVTTDPSVEETGRKTFG